MESEDLHVHDVIIGINLKYCSDRNNVIMWAILTPQIECCRNSFRLYFRLYFRFYFRFYFRLSGEVNFLYPLQMKRSENIPHRCCAVHWRWIVSVLLKQLMAIDGVWGGFQEPFITMRAIFVSGDKFRPQFHAWFQVLLLYSKSVSSSMAATAASATSVSASTKMTNASAA